MQISAASRTDGKNDERSEGNFERMGIFIGVEQ
jgi:hypothetical protein